MNYLNFYADNNSRITYSKDLSMTQYSTGYSLRVYSKVDYPSLSMEITTTDGLKTYKKYLVHELSLLDGYHVYSYALGLDITGTTVSASKSIIKISFTAFLDSTDESKKLTSGLCYIPLLANNEARPSDMSVSESDKNLIMSKLNELDSKIASLGVSKVQDYDETKGTIKEKFDSVDSKIANNSADISEINTKLNTTIDKVNTNTTNIDTLQDDVNTLKQRKGFEVVDSLPTSPDPMVIYLLKEGNVYKQYVYSNGQWKIIGETSDINISNYYTKTEANERFATKTSLPTKVSDLTNDTGFITNTANAFNYENLYNKPVIPNITNLTNKVNSIETTVNGNTSDITNIQTNISNLQSDISDVNTIATRAEAKIDGLETAKVFASKNALITYIQTQPTTTDKLGTSYLIKSKNTADYWLAAIYTEPTNYTNADGEVFTNVYYGIEKFEAGLSVDGYATEAWVESKGYITETAVDTKLSSKENLDNKIVAIGESSNDTEYPSAKAVRLYTTEKVNNLKNEVAGTYATKEALATKVDTTELANYATTNYVDTAISQIPTPDVSGQISEHNTSSTSHQDIRNLIATKQDIISSTNKLDYSLISNVPTIPSKVSDLENDTGFITDSSLTTIKTDITNLKNTGITADLVSQITTNKNNIETNTSDLTTLKGTGEGSVKKIVSDEISKIISNAPDSFDTLKEISDWISSHENDAASMNSAITTLQTSKQDKITESNKLDYSLISNVPETTSTIIRKWSD